MNGPLTNFLRFVLTGLLNTGFGYASYAALVLIGMPLWLAVMGSTVLAIMFNFYSYGGLVFLDTSASVMPRFLLFYATLGLTNYDLLHWLGSMGIGPLLAQAFLLPVLALLGYAGMRFFVFRVNQGAPDRMTNSSITEDFKPIPILLIPPLMVRPFIFDLTGRRSLVRTLLRALSRLRESMCLSPWRPHPPSGVG